MKITVQINGIDTEIELTSEQVASIEAHSTPKKFEWKYPRGEALLLHTNDIRARYHGTDSTYLEHGRYRLSKEVAEQSLLRNKRANRLEALAEQLGGLREWQSEGVFALTLETSGKYREYEAVNFQPEKVYMTKECALEICRMINEGLFSLDGEL